MCFNSRSHVIAAAPPSKPLLLTQHKQYFRAFYSVSIGFTFVQLEEYEMYCPSSYAVGVPHYCLIPPLCKIWFLEVKFGHI